MPPSWSTYKPGVLSSTSRVLVLMAAMGSGSIIILSSSWVISGLLAVIVTSSSATDASLSWYSKYLLSCFRLSIFSTDSKPTKLILSRNRPFLTSSKRARPFESVTLYAGVESGSAISCTVAPVRGSLSVSLTFIVRGCACRAPKQMTKVIFKNKTNLLQKGIMCL
ncbi:MAG: hypothetical protein BWY70_00984 [Bacteroidetes bacterium ADurb.Bin408]|nr:MAG: hypothetical protein BWY70_00984 [Bacteroidetes bacterium ADurb.Bin408]